jgi:uncharacterized protein YbaR (Trm112 family)
VFIELTDHLRCPANHPEQYLVLLPEKMDGRRVVTGELGCPVCGRVTRIAEGIADFGGATASLGRTSLTAEAVAAFLGLSGPGGYVALVGGVASLAPELTSLLPHIGLALVNPAEHLPDQAAGILRAARLPLKASSMRGVAIGADFAAEPEWLSDAAGAVLPGLRIVAEAGEPPASVELLARSPECWVGKRR